MSAGRQLGQYELIESLGAGGMGEVWLGRHLLLDRPAAVKLVHPDPLGGREESSERFLREARATSALQSPHTVELYDFGVTEDGDFYYVMELLHGLDLRTMVERHGPVDAARTIHIARAVCESLHEAHQRGLLHRDVKPANIFAARLGPRFDFPKVLDFGLVKAITDSARAGDQLTASNAILGTPAFMAPELATGSAIIDARADLYSLGCVLYWLLTGRLVFQAENAMGMVLAHAGEAPVPPSVHSELPLPQMLVDAVMRCLAKNPDDRFSSGAELSQFLGEVPVEEPWTQARASQWWDTHVPAFAEQTNQAWPRRQSEISLSLESSGPGKSGQGAPPADTSTPGRRALLLAVATVAALLVVTLGILSGVAGWFVPAPVPAEPLEEEVEAQGVIEGVADEPVALALPAPASERAPEPMAGPVAAPDPVEEPEPVEEEGLQAEPDPVEEDLQAEPVPAEEPGREGELEPVEEEDLEAEPEPAPEPTLGPRLFLADIELGAVLPSWRAPGGRRYTCLPYAGTARFNCRGYYSTREGGLAQGSGTWQRRIETCGDRVARSVQLSKEWSVEASADQDDEIEASKVPRDGASAAASAVAAYLHGQGFATTRSESGNDGRKRGGDWEVVSFRSGETTADYRLQQEGPDYTLTVTAVAPESVCGD